MNDMTIDAEAFEHSSLQDWRALAEKGLKGKPFESLSARSEDGYAIEPLYQRRLDVEPVRSAHRGAWKIVQPIDDTDPARANVQALADLEGGAGGLSLAVAGSASARGFGLPAGKEALSRALDGVALEMISLRIEPYLDGRHTIDALRNLAKARGLVFEDLDIDLCLDGIGPFAFLGGFPGDAAEFHRHCGQATKAMRASGFEGLIAEADGRVFHEAGASDGQELGVILAGALAYLKSLTDAGLSVEVASGAIGFTVAVDQRQFEQTAKLRALRLLWAKLLQDCGEAGPAPCRIHAETSFRMLSAKDPHTNILRSTIAAFAAGTGGADSLTVLPHTAPLGLADAAARRLARNTQSILLEECHLGEINDPACGSGGIEALTDLQAEAGWDAFRQIEREGGIFESLQAGSLQRRIAETAEARKAAVEAGERPLVGASIFALDEEREHKLLAGRDARKSPAAPAASGHDMRCERLLPHRLSEPLEQASPKRAGGGR